MEDFKLEEIEIKLLLEGIYQRYGFDFRDYSFSSIRRRVLHRVRVDKLTSVSALQEKVLHDPTAMDNLINDLCINVTEMFRDPEFFFVLRNKVLPLMKTQPFIRIWHAGCSSGEEAFSMAILLQEEGLYHKTKIYATDMHEGMLAIAKEGKVPLKKMKEYTKNYLDAGGREDFSHYYSIKEGEVIIEPSLRRNIVFAQHNLVTDGSFNEFHIIICRNVLIYFNQNLQERVHNLFNSSLSLFGILALGSKEDIKFTSNSDKYQEIDSVQKIYKKIR